MGGQGGVPISCGDAMRLLTVCYYGGNMQEMGVRLPEFRCVRCGHRWHPRAPQKPNRCAGCKVLHWDRKPRWRRTS